MYHRMLQSKGRAEGECAELACSSVRARHWELNQFI
jgi:hypothetical protein